MRIHCLQHEHAECAGAIKDWAEAHLSDFRITYVPTAAVLPRPQSYDLLVILGGSMGVYESERYAWMPRELEYIAEVIELKKKVFGICLGAQLIAKSQGANVYPGHEREIGWFPVQRSKSSLRTVWAKVLPQESTPLHWHGDTFDLPEGAVLIAENETYPHQGFAIGDNVLALQYHLEFRREDIEELVKEGSGFVSPGGKVQLPTEILQQREYFQEAHKVLYKILERFSRM